MRLSFIVGVSSSPPGSQSPRTSVNFLICSTRASSALPLSTASCTAATIRSSSASSVSDLPSIPMPRGQAGAKSASRTTSAVLYGRPSPITQTCPITGPAPLSVDSMLAGDMFLPAALMMISFLRSTIAT